MEHASLINGYNFCSLFQSWLHIASHLFIIYTLQQLFIPILVAYEENNIKKRDG